MRICVYFIALLLENIDFINFLNIRFIFVMCIRIHIVTRFIHFKNVDFTRFTRIYAFFVTFLFLYKFH